MFIIVLLDCGLVFAKFSFAHITFILITTDSYVVLYWAHYFSIMNFQKARIYTIIVFVYKYRRNERTTAAEV